MLTKARVETVPGINGSDVNLTLIVKGRDWFCSKNGSLLSEGTDWFDIIYHQLARDLTRRAR